MGLIGDSVVNGFKESVNAWSNLPSNLSSWMNNAMTGQRDYDRQVALQTMSQDFNSAEAVKAYDRTIAARKTELLDYATQLKSLGLNPAAVIAGGTTGGSTVSSTAAHSNAGSAGKSGGEFTALLGVLARLAIGGLGLASANNAVAIKALSSREMAGATLSAALLKNRAAEINAATVARYIAGK